MNDRTQFCTRTVKGNALVQRSLGQRPRNQGPIQVLWPKAIRQRSLGQRRCGMALLARRGEGSRTGGFLSNHFGGKRLVVFGAVAKTRRKKDQPCQAGIPGWSRTHSVSPWNPIRNRRSI